MTIFLKLQIATLFELVIWYFVRKLNIISHLRFKKCVIEIFEKSLIEEEKRNICQTVFDNNVNKVIFERMLKSRNCVISTASPYAYVSRVSLKKNVRVISSFDPQRDLPDPANLGPGKIKNLKAYFKGKPIRVINFYTDSNTDDKALIDFSDNVFVVKDGCMTRIK